MTFLCGGGLEKQVAEENVYCYFSGRYTENLHVYRESARLPNATKNNGTGACVQDHCGIPLMIYSLPMQVSYQIKIALNATLSRTSGVVLNL